MRRATIERKTQETVIRAVLNIDGRGQVQGVDRHPFL